MYAHTETLAFARSTEPEVFTFEPPRPAEARACVAPIRPRRRCARVMYPARVRMHLPPPERSWAKRWLLALCALLLWQVWTEDPCVGVDFDTDDPACVEALAAPVEDRRSSALIPAGAQSPYMPDCCPSGAPLREPDTFEQSAGKSYVVALLVYHRLGNDN